MQGPSNPPRQPRVKLTEFQLVKITFQRAVDDYSKFGSGRPESCWNYQMYKNPSKKHVQLYYCSKKDQSERVAQLFLDEHVLGFDLEWPVNVLKTRSIKQNVALIQLASEKRIALFHLSLHLGDKPEDLLAPTLKRILENPDVLKAGAAVSGDCTRLRTHLDISVRASFELSNLYKLVYFSHDRPHLVNRKIVKLSDMCVDVLGLPLYKGDDVRLVEWNRALKNDQLQYAASDAYAGLRLFDELNARRLAMEPTPPLPAFAEEKLPILFPRRDELEAVYRKRRKEEKVRERLDQGCDSAVAVDTPNETSEGVTASSAADDAEQDNEGSRDQSTIDTAGPSITRNALSATAAGPWPSPLPTDKAASRPPQEAPPRSQISPEVEQATTWATSFLSSAPSAPAPQNPAMLSHLRAYALWHHQALSIPHAASLLRSPPLQKATVAAYVAEALVREERLPFDAARVKEALQFVPAALVRGRYRWLVARVERGERGEVVS